MNITLKDVPKDLHENLRITADQTGRSLNKFILITLARALSPQKVDRAKLLRRVRARRDRMESLLTDEMLLKSIEGCKRRIAKRKATKEGIVTGKHIPYTGYDDEGFPLPDPPYWFLNLQKAWISNHKLGIKRRAARGKADKEDLPDARTLLSDPSAWESHCKERDITSKTKKAVGRPRLPDHLKKNPTKIRRSDQMRQLLSDHGVEINTDSSIDGFDGFEFMKNGRIKFLGDEDAGIEPYSLSAHQFLQDYL